MQKCKENAKHVKKLKITITYAFFKLQSKHQENTLLKMLIFNVHNIILKETFRKYK